MSEFLLGWLCGWIAVGIIAPLLSYCEPKALAKVTPAWMASWCLRIGMYVQAVGRENYHQCDQVKRQPIDAKLEKVYGPHKA